MFRHRPVLRIFTLRPLFHCRGIAELPPLLHPRPLLAAFLTDQGVTGAPPCCTVCVLTACPGRSTSHIEAGLHLLNMMSNRWMLQACICRGCLPAKVPRHWEDGRRATETYFMPGKGRPEDYLLYTALPSDFVSPDDRMMCFSVAQSWRRV